MTTPKELFNGRLLKAEEIYNNLGISKSTFYKGLKEGLFPQPFKIGARCNRWPESVWEDFLRGRGGASPQNH